MTSVAVLATVGVCFLLLTVLCGYLLAIRGFWQYFAEQWQRIPAGRRLAALRAGAIVFAFAALVALILVVEPWGNVTIVWIVGALATGLLVWGLGTAISQGVKASRRSKRPREGRDSDE